MNPEPPFPPPLPASVLAVLRLTGGILTLLGSLVILAWFQRLPFATGWLWAAGPTQLATAAGLLGCGLGLLALSRCLPRLTLAAGAAATLLGGSALAHTLLSWWYGPQAALWQLLPTQTQDYAAPVAPNVALCLMLAGTSLVLARCRRPVPWVVGLCGLAIVILTASSLTATLSGAGLAAFWPQATTMSLPTALGLALLGGALLYCAWSQHSPLRWRQAVPVAIGGAVIAGGAVFWELLELRDHRRLQEATRVEAASVSREIQLRLTIEMEAVERMGLRAGRAAEPAGPGWVADAEDYLQYRAYRMVAWLDPALTVVAVRPSAEAQDYIDRDLGQDRAHAPWLQEAVGSNEPRVSMAVPLATGGYGLFAYIPVQRGNELVGVIVSQFAFSELLAELTARQVERGFGLAIVQAGETIHEPPVDSEVPAGHAVFHDLSNGLFHGDTRLLVWPLPELSQQMISVLPAAALFLITCLGLLLALALRTREQLEASVRQLGELNRDLDRRVRERTADLQVQVTERERIATELERAAQHDALTGLPNRSLFKQLLDHALALARRDQRPLAVMFLDLDHFKEVNDTLGHQRGDELLVQTAARIEGALRHSDILARQGGDEFLILLEEVHGAADAIEVAEKVVAVMKQAFRLGDDTARVGVSVGIATYPDCGGDSETLIKHADAAMYRAKAAGRGGAVLYSSTPQGRERGPDPA